ncbi:flagellar hook-basal body complex protein FliE [Aquibium sp. A9E412]|uniref:flagellar hook-basal body complex protein FliE n=1 Tax=Aquibium sp. A9E412 TaxID=2976767 RepID=UPI0025B0D8C1|nr:flagellar hook-basal body complex protein FliE [Aquibium sp. A9E412]MDN2566602.1 flagellar hook-basal body complex protein FliE [Aquibium sp. A9E412]
MIPGLNALDPLAGVASQTTRPTAGATGAASGPDASFETLLAQAVEGTVSGLERAETLSMRALQGEADTREVVDAVMSAEQSLQAAIAVRDKIVTAYLEISRMAI